MHCLIIGKLWPEPTATAAGTRTLDIVQALLAAGWRVSFACAASRPADAFALEVLGVETAVIELNATSFDRYVGRCAPEVVLFDRFMTEEQYGWRVARACPDALRVLDTSDLHCLREARQQQLKQGGELPLGEGVAVRELASIYRSDRSLLISEAELGVLRDAFNVEAPLVQYWPFSLEPVAKDLPDYGQRAHFVMIGSLLHAPNLDAARWCKRVVWPLIRRALPGAELHCYGSYGERYAGELTAPKEGFFFKGRADDALATMREYRVNLAPLRFGAGLKGKLFDGFQSGTPSVGTAIAYEGIVADVSRAVETLPQIQDVPEHFAAAAVKLYRDAAAWREVQQWGADVVEERFCRADWGPVLPKLLEDARATLAQDRARNFIGRMLQHHQHKSTEYMSRWLELKQQGAGA